jgi:AraC-like DNA-binding protein
MDANGRYGERSVKALLRLFLGRIDGDPSQRPGLVIAPMGAIQVVAVPLGRSVLHHEGGVECSEKGSYCFLLQRSGSGLFQQYGHRSPLACGDVVLYEPACPWRYQSNDDGDVILLHVPARLLAENLPGPERLCGRRLGCNEGLTATVGAMAATLVTQLRDGLDELSRQRAANHLLGMIASCYAPVLDLVSSSSAVMSGRLWRVKGFIEENLRNPKLSSAMVANEMKLSPRYLRMIFAASEEPILAYVMRRRLEECANQLADPRWRGHSITEIAFGWGFNSAPHFTRSFRERFGVSPRQYRQRELAATEPLAA